ncbi:MAG TPA: S16 family serine protease, partial [Acidobacteriaceae bacterium]
AGIFEAVLSKENEKDLAELPDNLKKAMKLHFVETMDEVLKIALESPLPELKEEAPEALAAVHSAVPQEQPRAHQ